MKCEFWTTRKMNNASIYVLIMCISCACLPISGQDYAECQVWTDVMETMKRVDSVNVTCRHNPVCTGFDCNGIYNAAMNRELRFGAEFLPCGPSLQLVIYMSLGNVTTRRVLNVTTAEQKIAVPMPVSPRTSSFRVNSTILMVIQLVSPQNITFQMNSSIEFGSKQYMFILVPPLYIRVPDCVAKLSTHSFDAVNITTARPTPSIYEILTGAKCTVGILHSCGNMQTCRDGNCTCIGGRVWSKHQQECVKMIPPPSVAGTGASVIIIAVVCILAAVIFASILTVITIKYRRYRQRYGQHESLINNEGDDRDLDGDEADPPMLQA